MPRYIVGRLGQMLATLVVSTFAVFAIAHVLPGSPAEALAGPDASAAEVRAIARSLGLDRPLPVQYADWCWQLLHGNMGRSFLYDISARTLIFSRLPLSFELAGAGLVLAIGIAVPLGVLAATRPGGVADGIISMLSATLIGVPSFVFGILLIYIFAVRFHLLPVAGTASLESDPSLALRSLVLPAFALALGGIPSLVRLTRKLVMDALESTYALAAVAKGASRRRVLFGHALRSVAVPLTTMCSVAFGGMIAGAIIVEQVFAWPGVGLLLIQSLENRDYFVIQGTLLILLLIFLLLNLVTDLLYTVLDPRITIR